MTETQGILGPVLARNEARPLIVQAVRHFREARRATIQVMADLRRLQDGQVHLLYGSKNFAQWAEDTFEGLAQGNVRQLTRAGAIALELESRGYLDLRKPEGVGTTGLRELSVIANDFGNDKMVEVFLTAREMLEPGKEVAGTTVKAAMQLLMPPAQVEPLLPHTEQEIEEVAEEYATEHSAKINELIDRIRDLSWDLPQSVGELTETTEQLKAELAKEQIDTDQAWIEGTR